jgi:hypothetical protein
VDSSIPPPPSRSRHALRPWYLVAAMMLTWFVGVNGLMFAYKMAAFLHGGIFPSVGAAAQHTQNPGDIMEFAALSALQAVAWSQRVTFPLSIAWALLSGLLVVSSGLAMGGRRGSRTLALQALAANALFVALAYALTQNVRAAWVGAVLDAVATLPLDRPEHDAFGSSSRLWWSARLGLVGGLAPLALGALALTRARTKTYFEAVARMTESTEEP